MVKNKILMILFGVCAGLIVLELGLQLCSVAAAWRYLPQSGLKVKNDHVVRIICLGDSYTYGLGAEIDRSYPAHLERILNRSRSARGFEVINMGIPSYNSTQLLRKLKTAVDSIKPEIVIVIAGKNDAWNFRGIPENGESWAVRCAAFLSKLRTARLITLIGRNRKEMPPRKNDAAGYNRNSLAGFPPGFDPAAVILQGNILRDRRQFALAEALFLRVLAVDPGNRIALLELGRCYKLNSEYDAAAAVFVKLFYLCPEDKTALGELQDVLQHYGGSAKAIEIYSEMFRDFPADKVVKNKLVRAYVQTAGDFLIKNRAEPANFFYWKAYLLDPDEELAYNGIHLTEFMKTEKKGPRLLRAWINIREGFDGSSAYKKLIYDSVRKERILNGNLTEIVRVCREHNVRVIFSGYPVKVANVDVVMKQVAESAGVVLVDQAAVFETLLGKYPREKFFVSEIDTHCISEGYRVMAKNIAGQIIPRGPSFE